MKEYSEICVLVSSSGTCDHQIKTPDQWTYLGFFIDREAREIIRLVASIRPFVCLSVCVLLILIHGVSIDVNKLATDYRVFYRGTRVRKS